MHLLHHTTGNRALAMLLQFVNERRCMANHARLHAAAADQSLQRASDTLALQH
jgi:hypothetical protein